MTSESPLTLEELLYQGVLSCPHTIEHSEVVLRYDHRRPGHNALNQLRRRVEDALKSAAPASAPLPAAILFNINDSVRVKLNEEGRRIHRKQHDALVAKGFTLDYHPPREDAEGWSRWQLWDLMATFGPHIYLGGTAPFDTTIEIPHTP